MSERAERRNLSVQRVDLTTLVDICVQDGQLSPFQAESANVSGRGMQVRTSHLPEIGQELVCRFEHSGAEILVEGRVAWRAEGEDSGEFGIQFTALDASSAEILKELGQSQRASAPRRSAVPKLFALDEEEPEEEGLSSGDRVRLHIDGLGAPMKACVHDGSARKVRVGSSLEFLKLGRALQIEEVEGGETRGAHVDSVNVVMNPSTAVPELVVMLRYEGISPTPPPASVKDRGSRVAAPSFVDPADDWSLGAVRQGSSSEQELHGESPAFEEEEEILPEGLRPAADAIRERLEGVWGTASSVAGKAGGWLSQTAERARASVEQVRKKPRTTAASRRREIPARAQAPRRTTAPPAHLRSSLADAGVVRRERLESKGSLRPSSQTVQPVNDSQRLQRLAVLAGFAFIVLGGSAWWMRSRGVEPSEGISVSAVAPQDAAGKPAAAGTQEAQVKPVAPTSPEGIVAEVPLFGPKAMATSETVNPKAPDLSDAAAEKLAAAAAVEDEAWSEDSAPAGKRASEVTPWGRGKLHLPTIHRIRLDGEGGEIAGAVEASGFTVVIPGRKAMESGRAIEKRDRRIVQAKASNTARGASIHFEFRGAVPAYRVRLRNDFVEFLISAPEDGLAQR